MDYEALKAKEEEIRAKREKLLAECEVYEKEMYAVQKEMQQLDHTKFRLNSSQEHILRLNLGSMRDREYCYLTFYKYDLCLYDNEVRGGTTTIDYTDSIINIESTCYHESQIISLSDHAFNICCEVLGQPHGNGDLMYNWVMRK
jgi:hypothetical protein